MSESWYDSEEVVDMLCQLLIGNAKLTNIQVMNKFTSSVSLRLLQAINASPCLTNV